MLGDFSLPLFLATIIVALFGMGWHEFGHAMMAHYWGDPTPKRFGRLTPNPFAHINPGGFLFFLMLTSGFVGGLGSLGPILIALLFLLSFMRSGSIGGLLTLGSVPVNPGAMRDPRWGNFWTSFAGPLLNLAQALLAALAIRLFFGVEAVLMVYFNPQAINTPIEFIMVLLLVAVFVNVAFGIFNLLPLSPLDGWQMMLALLPGHFLQREQVPQFVRKHLRPLALFLQQPAYKWRDWQYLSYIVFTFLLIAGFMLPGFNVLGRITGPATFTLIQLLLGY